MNMKTLKAYSNTTQKIINLAQAPNIRQRVFAEDRQRATLHHIAGVTNIKCRVYQLEAEIIDSLAI